MITIQIVNESDISETLTVDFSSIEVNISQDTTVECKQIITFLKVILHTLTQKKRSLMFTWQLLGLYNESACNEEIKWLRAHPYHFQDEYHENPELHHCLSRTAGPYNREEGQLKKTMRISLIHHTHTLRRMCYQSN